MKILKKRIIKNEKLIYEGNVLSENDNYPFILNEYNRVIDKLKDHEYELTNEFLSEIAKRAVEFAFKKYRDSCIFNNLIQPKEMFDGAYKLLYYLESLEYNRNITSEISIKFKNPIIRTPKGENKKVRNNFKDFPEVVYQIKGESVINYLESVFTKSIDKEILQKMKNALDQEITTFGNIYSYKKQTEAQYSKNACKNISNYLKSIGLPIEKIREITIIALELVSLVMPYSENKELRKSQGKYIYKERSYRTNLYNSLVR